MVEILQDFISKVNLGDAILKSNSQVTNYMIIS